MISGPTLPSIEAGPGVTRVVVSDVTRLFGRTPALRAVSATFERGQLTVLSGPNGAGKSTLLSIIGTRLRPTRGKVAYMNAQGQLDSSLVRRDLGWVSHESLCYQELSGRRNIELVLALHGLPLARYAEVAELVELGKFAERPVATLSRGQRQRVSLARALCHDPSLLLLDEPWTGLDVQSAALLEKLTLERTSGGAITIVVSHEPGIAERLGAREVRLEGGRVRSI
jgi:ABC-type multidrug transport system ATPase subunit